MDEHVSVSVSVSVSVVRVSVCWCLYEGRRTQVQQWAVADDFEAFDSQVLRRALQVTLMFTWIDSHPKSSFNPFLFFSMHLYC